MSSKLKLKFAKRGRPNKVCRLEKGSRRRAVGEKPFLLEDVIDMLVGDEQTKIHQRLCLEFLDIRDGRSDAAVSQELFSGEFCPPEALPGAKLIAPLQNVGEYKTLLKNLEQKRTSSHLKHGYSPADFAVFYTGWKSSVEVWPINRAPTEVMSFYKGRDLTYVNAHLHTFERWSDQYTRPGQPQGFDLEIINAPFLTEKCGGSGGKGKCQCQRELICNRSCYESFPLVSPLARLQRQAMARAAYVNARLQSSYLGESIVIDETFHTEESDQEEQTQGRHDEWDFDPNISDCMAVDRYLMTMMPQEPDGSRDNERYLQLPIGSINGAWLALQKITVCPDTFRKIFCLSLAEEKQLLRWSKAAKGLGLGVWNNQATMLRVHRCKAPLCDILGGQRGACLLGKKRTGIRKKIQRPKVSGEDLFWSNLEKIERIGVVQRPSKLMTKSEKEQFSKQWNEQDLLASRRFRRFSEGMIQNDRHDPRFNAYVYSWPKEKEDSMMDDKSWKGRTMWVPSEGYEYAGNNYKFRIDSYFQDLWFQELGRVMSGQMLKGQLPAT
jgi:hypothetical protein